MTAPISHAAMLILGWRRVDPKPWRKTAAVWAHTTGWRLVHCGHPTAIHPFLLIDRFGTPVLSGVAGPKKRADFGTAWNTLREPAEWLAQHLAAGEPMLKRGRERR